MKAAMTRMTHGHYLKGDMEQFGKIIAEYIWIDGSGVTVRSKSRTLEGKITDVADLPDWNFDGSSTEQAVTEDSEVILKPVAFFSDPFRGGDNILVLCETFRWASKDHSTLRP
jgi:glutamine synthetase